MIRGNSTVGWSLLGVTANKYHHHGEAGRLSSAMAFAFPATPPREPLRKGLAESDVVGFN